MKVSSATSQVVAPSRPSQGVNSQNQNVDNHPNGRLEAGQHSVPVTSEKYESHNSKCSMSTEDFLQLHNSSTEQMLDTIKDIMALEVMQKSLEVIDKIVAD